MYVMYVHVGSSSLKRDLNVASLLEIFSFLTCIYREYDAVLRY